MVVAPTPTPAPSPIEIVLGYSDAFNTQDIEAVTRLLADEVVVTFGQLSTDGSTQTLTGRAEVLKAYLQNLEINPQFNLSAATEEGNQVTAQFSSAGVANGLGNSGGGSPETLTTTAVAVFS